MATRMIKHDGLEALEKDSGKIELEVVKTTSSSGADRQFHPIITQHSDSRAIAKQFHSHCPLISTEKYEKTEN